MTSASSGYAVLDEALERCAFAGPDLASRRGVQTYASLRMQASGPRVTVYLAPQVHTR